MRLHRFYISRPITATTFDISDRDLVHQWKHVFRYNVGSQVIMFDGSGFEYLSIISSLRNLGATLSLIRKTSIETSVTKNVWLCMSLVKKDNFELITEKATELGVSHIVPILSEHSEKKKINMERLQKIAIEASEQSGRGDVPEILETKTLADIFAGGTLPQEKIVFHPTGSSFQIYFKNVSEPSIAIFIGPEGGWSDSEIALFKSYNVPICSLGTQILRVETAAIASLGLLLL